MSKKARITGTQDDMASLGHRTTAAILDHLESTEDPEMDRGWRLSLLLPRALLSRLAACHAKLAAKACLPC